MGKNKQKNTKYNQAFSIQFDALFNHVRGKKLIGEWRLNKKYSAGSNLRGA